MPLTDTGIRKVKPGEKPARIFGGSGLYLQVSPAGAELWPLKYRFHCKEKLLALGVCPDVSPASARQKRDEGRTLLAESLTTRCAMRLAALVFARPGELLHAEWTEFDFDKAEWRIPPAAARPRLRVTSTAAVEVQTVRSNPGGVVTDNGTVRSALHSIAGFTSALSP